MTVLAAAFADPVEARSAVQALVAAGIGEERIVLSIPLTDDAIAAEAPGQSFENQSYEASDDVDARFNELMRTAACVVSVKQVPAGESDSLAELLRSRGAHAVGVDPTHLRR